MHSWADLLMLVLILANLALLSSSRLALCIRLVALQGILVGCLPLLQGAPALGPRPLLLAGAAILLKGLAFPVLLFRALRSANISREVEPFVGFTFSLVLGVCLLIGLLGLGVRLALPFGLPSALSVPTAWFTSLTGLFLIVARKKALTQVLGYLSLENGIYAFGTLLASEQPWLVEMGVLFDVFVAVFIMGIIIFHISREFNHVDTSRLAYLQDWRGSGKPAPRPALKRRRRA